MNSSREVGGLPVEERQLVVGRTALSICNPLLDQFVACHLAINTSEGRPIFDKVSDCSVFGLWGGG